MLVVLSIIPHFPICSGWQVRFYLCYWSKKLATFNLLQFFIVIVLLQLLVTDVLNVTKTIIVISKGNYCSLVAEPLFRSILSVVGITMLKCGASSDNCRPKKLYNTHVQKHKILLSLL